MNLETVTRPMEMFRDQMLRLGVQVAKQGRHVSLAALRNGAHALALTAERLDTLAKRLDDAAPEAAPDATTAETPADAAPEASAAPAVEATAADEATAPDATATEAHGASKKKHRRNHAS